MSKLKLSATLSEDDLRSISEWSAGQRDTAKEQGRREGIEEVAVWLEGKMPKWGAASKGMAAEVRALVSPELRINETKTLFTRPAAIA